MKTSMMKNAIIGFFLGIIPQVFIDIWLVFILGFFKDYYIILLRDIGTYGIIGIIVSLIYSKLFIKYPKISNYIILSIIAIYYLVFLIIFIMAIYLKDKII